MQHQNLISELGMALAIHLMDFLGGLSIKRDRGIKTGAT
jgi:predicted CDP-diglyceride synthetase/phosphatidate cytidylyltransferase